MIVDLIIIAEIEHAKTDSGYPLKVETKYDAVAERMSVKRSEFYEAYKVGLKPTVVYRLHPLDYPAGAIYVEEGGVKYKILRTYETGPDAIEITCEKEV